MTQRRMTQYLRLVSINGCLLGEHVHSFLCMTTPKCKCSSALPIILCRAESVQIITFPVHPSKWVRVRNVLQLAPSIFCVSTLHNEMYQLTQTNIAMATTTGVFLPLVHG